MICCNQPIFYELFLKSKISSIYIFEYLHLYGYRTNQCFQGCNRQKSLDYPRKVLCQTVGYSIGHISSNFSTQLNLPRNIQNCMFSDGNLVSCHSERQQRILAWLQFFMSVVFLRLLLLCYPLWPELSNLVQQSLCLFLI